MSTYAFLHFVHKLSFFLTILCLRSEGALAKPNAGDMLKRTTALYDKRIAAGYIDKHYARKWWRSVASYYPNRSRWLEAGCGACGLVKTLLRTGYDAFGVEISDSAISGPCRDLVREGRVKKGSLHRIPFESAQFDLVFSSEVLEHIPVELIPSVIKELKRVAKGKLFLSISLRRSKLDPKPPTLPVIHVTVKSRQWWEEMFSREGCTIDQEVMNHFPKNVKHEPWFFPFHCITTS